LAAGAAAAALGLGCPSAGVAQGRGPPLVGAKPVSMTAAERRDLGGIWTPDQGVIWDTAAPPGGRENPPFTPKYAALYQEALDASAAGKPKVDPPTQCLPPGFPRMMASPFPFEIVQTPTVVYLMHEYMSQNRRMFMKGGAPKPAPFVTYNGFSVAHWEGDVLVVETDRLVEDSVLDTTHVGHSDVLKVVERLRKLAPDKLEDEITLIDEKAYTRPWTVLRTYTKKPGEQILEYVCEENNRNPVDEAGNTGFIGPQ
jgi:hypothetical protein